MMTIQGEFMYSLAERLFPICRSITGDGVRETLKILSEVYPITIKEIPSGTKVFDWVIPREWNIKDAYIEDESGNKIIDFKNNNLHVMGYSLPVDTYVSLEKLKEHLYTEPNQPDAIPYITSYYSERFGFCMSENQKNALTEQTYHMYIDSTLEAGNLTYGEIIIESPGAKEEIFLSTYICHPSMCNNEISGMVMAITLAKHISEMEDRRYNYRIVFVPETIGSITYLSKNYLEMKEKIIAGFNITCVGDNNAFSHVESRYGNNLSDRVARNILKYMAPNYKKYSFLERGSDERQYCAPGIDLPICTICRSKFGEFNEYHTSLDNLGYISAEGLQGAYDFFTKAISVLEYNYYFKVNCLCEPQLGRRGLYPTLSRKSQYDQVKAMTNFIAYSDGSNDLVDIAEIVGVAAYDFIEIAKKMVEHGLIEKNTKREKISELR